MTMTKNKTLNSTTQDEFVKEQTAAAVENRIEETLSRRWRAFAPLLVVGLFILTFLGQNFVIPSGSMRIRCWSGIILWLIGSPWRPFEMDAAGSLREPKRGDVVVFLKPVADLDKDGNPIIHSW